MATKEELQKAMQVIAEASNGTTDISKEIVVKHINDTYQDSFEIGTPSKGGVVKVYVDFDDVEAAKQKMINAVNFRKWAADLIDGTLRPQ